MSVGGQLRVGLIIGAKAGLDMGQLHRLLMDASAGSKTLAGYKASALKGNFEPGFTINNQVTGSPSW